MLNESVRFRDIANGLAVLDNASRSQNNKQLKKVLAQGETMSCSTYHSVSALPAPSNPTSAATGLFSGAVLESSDEDSLPLLLD